MELVEVTARFDDKGTITPLKFTWQGSQYSVTSTGRAWEDEAGKHVLVMVPGERVFELLFVPASGLWYLKQPYSPRQRV
jgi:hypothetical protein